MGSLYDDIKSYFTSAKTAQKRHKSPLRDVLSFERLMLVTLPTLTTSIMPSETDRHKAASDIAETVYKALSDANVTEYDRLVFHLPKNLAVGIRKLFATPEQVTAFEGTCALRLFQPTLGGQNDDQIILMEHDLDFNPAFDDLLEDRMIVRPLATGTVLIADGSARSDRDAVQVLIGVMEIRTGSTTIASQPIWAYRSQGTNPRITVNADFDLLAKGFPREERTFPLGVDIQCLFQERGGVRQIDQVTFDFSQAKCWLQHVPDLRYRIGVGAAGSSRWVDLRDYLKSSPIVTVKQEKNPRAPHFKVSENIQIPLDRFQSLIVGAGNIDYTYTCGFFPYALTFDPARNRMSFTGQLVPTNGAEIVFAPSFEHQPEPAFTLETSGARTDEFVVTPPALSEYTLSCNGTLLAAPMICRIGESIIAQPKSAAATQGDEHTFTICDTGQVPAEVLAARKGKYCAFVQVNPPADRFFELSESEHVFGRGRSFPSDAVGVAVNGVRFERPYVALKVVPSKSQEIFIVSSSSALSPNTLRGIAEKIAPEGRELYLNSDYDLYIGEFKLTLNLAATPNSAMVLSVGGP